MVVRGVVGNIYPRIQRGFVDRKFNQDSKKAENLRAGISPIDWVSPVVWTVDAQASVQEYVDRASVAVFDLRKFPCN